MPQAEGDATVPGSRPPRGHRPGPAHEPDAGPGSPDTTGAPPGDTEAVTESDALMAESKTAARREDTAGIEAGTAGHRQTVDLDGRSVLVAFLAVLGVIAAAAVAASGTLTTLLVVATLVAFALDPVVGALGAWLHLRRGNAVALLMGVLVIVVGIGIAALGPQTVEQARSFQQDLPRVVDDLGDLPWIGPELIANDVPHKIQDWAAQLPRQLGGETAQLTNAAEVATSTLLAGVATFLLLVALLVDGPRLVETAVLVVPFHRRESAQRYGAILGRVIGRYFAGSLVLAGLQGLQVLITGLVLGVPLSPLLAVWAAVWNMVPQIGGAIGGIVFVLVAFTQGPTVGVIAGIVFLLYMTFSNNVLLPIILGKAVDISPLSTMAATIGGFFVAGIVGAMLAVPLLGAGKAMYHEVRRRRVPERAVKRPRVPVRQVARKLRRPPDGDRSGSHAA